MDENKVAMPTGVSKRGAVYQLRVKVPKDLRPLYDTDTRYRASLNTSDKGEARMRALALWAQFSAEFEQRRREANPAPLATVSETLRLTLADAVYATALARDHGERRDKAATLRRLDAKSHGVGVLMLPLPDESDGDSVGAAVLAALSDREPSPLFTIPAGESPLAGLTPAQRQARAVDNQRRTAVVADAVAGRNLETILPLAEQQARRFGLKIDWTTQDGQDALEACLSAYQRARLDAVRRDSGTPVDTPPPPELPADPVSASTPEKPQQPRTSTKSLRDVLPHWSKWRQAKDTAIGHTERALRRLEAGGFPLDLPSITRAHGRDFFSYLKAGADKGEGATLSDKTASNQVDCIRALLEVAATELEWIERNPWRGMELPREDSDNRPAWTAAQLAQLFGAPLFQVYELPTVERAGGPAAYWLPLLGLHSGARVGELAQMEVTDVLEDADGHWLDIHKRASGSKLKTRESERRVAVHPELIRLGFLDYCAAMRQAKATALFAHIPRTASRSRSDNFSQWFGQFRRELGINGRYPDFHSFRHNARQCMRDAGIDARVADAVTGHASQGGTGDTVYARDVAPAVRRRAVEAIQYPGLALPRVYPKP